MFRSANAVMALLFLVATAVQYNDPDPLRWMAIYGAAALLAAWAAARPLGSPRWLAAAVGATALLWSAVVALGAARLAAPGDLFRHWHMDDVAVEETRESLGLLIVAAWMAVLCLRRRPRP